MTSAKRWLLPDGVEEILPEEASKLENLRRDLLDLYESWGYELVITPLIEYLDSLLVGSSQDLDLHTFKITDQLSGRMMGIRADITPQAARIDAHCLNREGPVRLCYADNVLHTKPRGLLTSRVPIRVGAEMYGHAGVDCDIELICLMYATLNAAEIDNISLVLGHVGIFRAFVKEAAIDAKTEATLFDAVQRKAYDEIDEVLDAAVKDTALHAMFRKLTRLSGGEATLQEAVTVFEDAPASVKKELLELVLIVEGVKQRHPEITLCFDLCELRGYEYHTGIVFAAYTPDYGRAVAKGGRYDHIGEVFGRSRPASGFDSDLKTIAKLSGRVFAQKKAIIAPNGSDAELLSAIAALRDNGEIVISNLLESDLEQQDLEDLNCDRQLRLIDGKWTVNQL
ncbi:MAG: ATP phosphoribosyltransferase regulatory subunit [Pseudohongiella sp.]|nr:MAG: ATP phosphoribosyltransferase regulatory subunit [Pseudohongiella sp.]